MLQDGLPLFVLNGAICHDVCTGARGCLSSHPLHALVVDALLVGGGGWYLRGGFGEEAWLALLPFVMQPNSVFHGVGYAEEPYGAGLS